MAERAPQNHECAARALSNPTSSTFTATAQRHLSTAVDDALCHIIIRRIGCGLVPAKGPIGPTLIKGVNPTTRLTAHRFDDATHRDRDHPPCRPRLSSSKSGCPSKSCLAKSSSTVVRVVTLGHWIDTRRTTKMEYMWTRCADMTLSKANI
jgi:hypothetical protein